MIGMGAAIMAGENSIFLSFVFVFWRNWGLDIENTETDSCSCQKEVGLKQLGYPAPAPSTQIGKPNSNIVRPPIPFFPLSIHLSTDPHTILTLFPRPSGPASFSKSPLSASSNSLSSSSIAASSLAMPPLASTSSPGL